MYCNYCGRPMVDQAIVCSGCGRQVAAVAPRRRLVRPRYDRTIAGVCAACGNYFAIDVTLMRILWVLATLFSGGGGIIAYIVAWILIPQEPELLPAPQQAVPAQPRHT